MAKRKARRRKTGDFSGGSFELYGFEELLEKIEDFGTKALNVAVYSALKSSEQPVKRYMTDFIESHKEGRDIPFPYTQDTPPRGKGQTNKYYESHVWWRGNTITMICGFEKADYVKGNKEAQKGLSALFLDVGTRDAMGTPRITPTFFMYYAVRNNADEIKRRQKTALEGNLKKWWNDNQIVSDLN